MGARASHEGAPPGAPPSDPPSAPARRLGPLANAALSLVAVLGLCVVAYLFAVRHPSRIDLTRGGRYSLAPETRRLLETLPADVTTLAFYKDEDARRLAMEDLLVECAAIGGRFRYQFVDPDRSPGLARAHGVSAYGTTVVTAGGRSATLFTPSEARLANAIVRVTRDGGRRVAFLTGHGERALADDREGGYSSVARALADNQVEAHDVSLLRDAPDLSREAAVVLAGPLKDILPEEREALARYLDTGGALLALIDPGPCPEIARLLAREGIGLGDDIVVDRLSQVFGADILVPVVSEYPKTEITRDFRLATFYPIARSVALLDSAPAGAEQEAVVVTSAGSWGERDTELLLRERKTALDPVRDRPGPLALAVSCERPAGTRRARVLVFGDADFADNAHIDLSGNGDLFQNALAWVMGDEEPATVRARERIAEPVVLSSRQSAFLFWVSVVVVPGLALLAGAVVLLRRR